MGQSIQSLKSMIGLLNMKYAKTHMKGTCKIAEMKLITPTLKI